MNAPEAWACASAARAGQRTRLAGQDLQVVIQFQVLGPGSGLPRMGRGQPGPVEDLQLVSRQPYPDPGVDQPGGHRIAALAETPSAQQIARPGDGWRCTAEWNAVGLRWTQWDWFPGLAGLLVVVPQCFMMCLCEPLRSSGYGHMADGIGAEPAVYETACSWISVASSSRGRVPGSRKIAGGSRGLGHVCRRCPRAVTRTLLISGIGLD